MTHEGRQQNAAEDGDYQELLAYISILDWLTRTGVDKYSRLAHTNLLIASLELKRAVTARMRQGA